MAQNQIRWDLQIMDLSIGNTQLKDADIQLSKLTEGADLMKGSNNLSDLSDSAVSRDNLGLWTAAIANTGEAAWNVPVLDADGKLAEGILPSISVSEVYSVATIADRDALTVQTWDIAVVADNSADGDWTWTTETFIYDGTAWISMKSYDGVTSVAGKTWDVTLEIADVTNLQASLDAKLDDSQLSTNSSLGTDDTLIPSQAAVKAYVDNATAPTVATTFWEELTVTDWSAEVSATANVPEIDKLRVYLNGNREFDWTISGSTITFGFNLKNNALFKDTVFVDYDYAI